MPIYEYECPKCGRFEIIQKVREPALTKCSNEGCTELVTKLLSPCNAHFIGPGFYQTDYKGSSPSKAVTKKSKVPKNDKK